MEWVDRANLEHVPINDHVLRTAAQEIMLELKQIPTLGEDYTDFDISNGWLFKAKRRHGLSSKRTRGDGGGIDEAELPEMRANLHSQLENYALPEIFNCDELALQ